jgi:hypothetical protein
MNAGEKIPYKLKGSVLKLGKKNEIVIDLADRQKNEQITIDIGFDEKRNLIEGKGIRYAAVIIIPPPRFEYETKKHEKRYVKLSIPEVGQKAVKEIEVSTIDVKKKKALILDIESVTLQLWAVPISNL